MPHEPRRLPASLVDDYWTLPPAAQQHVCEVVHFYREQYVRRWRDADAATRTSGAAARRPGGSRGTTRRRESRD
jgi:hypothetical protein